MPIEPATRPTGYGGSVTMWTVETWRVLPGREEHFLSRCAELVPGELILYRDLEQPGLYWSPTRWEDQAALESWRNDAPYRAALDAICDDVAEHATSLMESVEGIGVRDP